MSSPSPEPDRPRGWRAVGAYVLDHESRLFALVLGALAADQWRVLALHLNEYGVFLANGIYSTPVLSLLVTGLSALYMTVIVFILWTAARPVARYDSLMPNLLAALAGFGIYAFGLLEPSEERLVNVRLPLALLAIGVVIVLWSLCYLRRSFSVVPQARRFVRRGPYVWIRHPMYLGNIVTIAGLGLLLGTPEAGAMSCVLAALQFCRSRYEDHLLASTFDDYKAYMKQVNAFIPRWRRTAHLITLCVVGMCLYTASQAPAWAQADGLGKKARAALAANCQSMHRMALAGQWFPKKAVQDYFTAFTSGESLPACQTLQVLIDGCNETLFELDGADPGPRQSPSADYIQASAKVMALFEKTPACKAVAGFNDTCRALKVQARRGATLSPKIKAILSECADGSIARTSSGIARGGL